MRDRHRQLVWTQKHRFSIRSVNDGCLSSEQTPDRAFVPSPIAPACAHDRQAGREASPSKVALEQRTEERGRQGAVPRNGVDALQGQSMPALADIAGVVSDLEVEDMAFGVLAQLMR